MPIKIVLLGAEEKNLQFIKSALRDPKYQFEFIQVDKFTPHSSSVSDARLFIIDTLPFTENRFHHFYVLREDNWLARIPVLALVKEKPPRLRYRLIDMGISDYLTVPFDRLDLQVRVDNLLHLNRISRPVAEEMLSTSQAESPPMRALEVLQHLYQEMNATFLNLNYKNYLDEVLEQLRQFCGAHFVSLLRIGDEEKLHLESASPNRLFDEGFSLPVSETPALVKAVRMKEPTILNRITSENSFVIHVSSILNIRMTSYIVYPIVVQEKTHSVLFVLKSDQEKFTDWHYIMVKNVAQLIIQAIALDNLKEDIQEQKDGQVWKFYFDFLDQVINQLNFGILIIDQAQRIKYLNDHAAKLLNVISNEVLYRPLSMILHEEALVKILESMETSNYSVGRQELELEKPGGEKIQIGFTVQEFSDQVNREIGYILSLKDITHAKEVQEEMRRVDRLASLGVMASGIAHEIRNPLAGIKAMAQTFEEELDRKDPKSEYVKRIIRLVNRLDDLLRTIFSYAKPAKPNRQPCIINSLLNDVISLIRQKLKENNIQLMQSIHPDLPRVIVDFGQIQQVLMNLLLNSIEAIDKDGQIEINIVPFDPENVSAEEAKAPYLALVKPRPYIKIQIKDDGCGIPGENLKQIFNPFFTTKSFGTGLGLSIVYQIVKENEGVIYFESEVDMGTECLLFLPAENRVNANQSQRRS